MNNQKFPLRQSGEMIQRAIDGALYPDGTLTAENVPADAAAVGRKVEELSEKISNGENGGTGGAEILPFGGSKEWLEINGDKDQLYQIDGYVWGFIESDGWTKSGVQYRLVSDVNAMTDAGGTAYMLRDGDIGTVYTYTAASGDVGVPVYGSLPQSANAGDVVAVGGRKYRAALSQMSVPNFTNLADTSSEEWLQNHRCNSTGVKEAEGLTVTNIIEMPAGSVLRITGIDLEAVVNGEAASQQVQKTRGYIFSTTKIKDNPLFYTGKTDGIYTFENTDAQTIWYRFSGAVKDGDGNVVITVNEEITYHTETVVTWKDIGAYVAPVGAGWHATDVTHPVIDSLDAAAPNGMSAVYSADGYLYTYISGAEWMKVSKYDPPSLTVDDELSETSKNAISNRAVTEEIAKLWISANRHDLYIDAINARLTGIETGTGTITIPSQWQSAVDACIGKIKALQNGRNCVTFPFFSDNHQRNGYAGILISHIMRECGIPYAFYGGDAITNGVAVTADSDAEFRSQAAAFLTMMAHVPSGKFCMALGNHEGYLKKNTSIAGSVDVTYTPQQQFDVFLRGAAAEQNKTLGVDGTYYYVEDRPSRTRFVVLNTRNNTLDAEQLSWFDETALEFSEPGWAVVIISHIPISNHYDGANIPNAADVVAIVNAHQKSTSPNRPDVVGWFSGHIHRDRIFKGMSVNDTDDAEGAPLGFTQVTITSDNTSIAYPVGNSPTTHPIDGSNKSHAIDFVTINRDTRTVNITRLGIGEDRSYTY